jgi:hypothetical protein
MMGRGRDTSSKSMSWQACGRIRGYTSLSKLWKYSRMNERFGRSLTLISDVKRFVMNV